MSKGKTGEPAGSESEKAHRAVIHRTLPNRKTSHAITGASATFTNGLAIHAGRYVWLCAKGGDVYVWRGAAAAVVGEALPILSGTCQEIYVDPAGEMDFSAIGSGVCTLVILDDNEIG